MRYYGVRRGIHRENIKYTGIKLRSFLMGFLSYNKEKRKIFRSLYDSEYREMDILHRNLAIPENKYYSPICIITSDLVLKENIAQLKSGLLELLEDHYTHKFFGASSFPEDLSKSIDEMDQTLISGAYWRNIGWCDFERRKLLKKYISYYGCRFFSNCSH